MSYLLVSPADISWSEKREVTRQIEALQNISDVLREDTIWMTTAAEAVNAAFMKRK